MNPIVHNRFSLSLAFVVGVLLSQSASSAATPAEQDVLRMHNSLPKKVSDSLFSYTVEWRKDQEELYRVTGLSFLNPAKIDSETDLGHISKKIVSSLKDGMIQLDPGWRGVTVNQIEDKPELKIANKAGYSLTSVFFRDYTNQALIFDLSGNNFAGAGVELAIDLVYAADVDYLDGFTSRKSQTASQGEIEIQIGEQKPILLKTDGKTTQELETEIARDVAQARLADAPLIAHVIGKDKRNNKPFDGSEVQLASLAAKSIRIDVNDPNLGVLIKFKFPDDNNVVKVVEPRFMMVALAALSLIAVGYFWLRNRKKPT